MDSNLIYQKTAYGEEAMHQRTRLMQRNVRMILILVDGQSTVADLCAKTGNPQLTENALGELEKGGFIELRIEQDSLWAESKKVAQEIRAAAIDKATQISLPRNGDELSAPQPKQDQELAREFVDSMFQIPLRSDSPLSQFSIAPIEPEQFLGEKSPIPEPKKKATKKPKRFETPREPVAERIRARLFGTRRISPIKIKPPRRANRSLGWPLGLTLGLLIVLCVGYLGVVLFPYGLYLPEVEKTFAESSGQRVRIEAMRVELYPIPALLLEHVRINTPKSELRIEEIRLLPEIGTLTSPRRVFREVVLSGITLPAAAVAELPGVFANMARSAAKVGVARVRLEKASIAFAGLGFSGLEGEANLSSAGLFQSLLLRSPERDLSLEAVPSSQGLGLTIEGRGWRPSPSSLYRFDSANLKGKLDDGALTIADMDLRIFDGQIRGTAVLGTNLAPNMSGEISFERISAARLGTALGIGEQLAGETSGKLRFSSSAASWESIFSAINAEGDFSMRRGRINGIDLAEAVRRISDTTVQGGETVFEELTGKIRLTPTNYRFQRLVLSSGLMRSTGDIEINKDLDLSGKLELQMRGSVNQTRFPIAIGGTLKIPVVQTMKK
jgi:hypothetical protein